MKAIAISHNGLEDVSASEIKELINVESAIRETVLIFEPNDVVDLCRLCYNAQSLIRVLIYLDSFLIHKDLAKTIAKLKKQIEKLDFSSWLDKKMSFKVECERIGDHDFTSQNLEKEIGRLIMDNLKSNKNKPKVDLENPDVIFYAYVYNDNLYLGIDLCGFDLSKRDYRIFGCATALKGTIAYCVFRLSGFKEGVLLDPFTGSGTIPIEAGLFFFSSPNHFRKDSFAFIRLKQFKKTDFDKLFDELDKSKNAGKLNVDIIGYDYLLRDVKSAQKNAKIAGVLKQIKFSRVSIDSLDLKCKEKSVDMVVCNPPRLSRNVKIQDLEKVYNELFYQSAYILKDKGTVTLITKTPDLIKKNAEKHEFKVTQERALFLGQEKLFILSFGRQNENC